MPGKFTTDQGNYYAHERYVFANPFMPEICPVLALSMPCGGASLFWFGTGKQI